MRGALESIPKAQYESSYVLGLSGWQTFTKVILPQALRRLLPASVNLATRIVKTTSLAVLLGVVEVIKVGQQIIDANRFQYPTGTFVDLRNDFLHVLHRVLAAVHRGPQVGKEVEA